MSYAMSFAAVLMESVVQSAIYANVYIRLWYLPVDVRSRSIAYTCATKATTKMAKPRLGIWYIVTAIVE